MKRVYLIGGTMGVGKTTVSRLLQKKSDNSVFLDGDWCWDSHPFTVTEETRTMVLENICFLLNQFMHCSAYETIIFCWVMHEQKILDSILANVDRADCEIVAVSLICSESELTARLKKDIEAGRRSPDVIGRSIARIPCYAGLKTVKIQTDKKPPNEIADEIAAL